MSELKRMTICELKKIIKDLPDDTFVLGSEDYRPTTEIFVKENDSHYCNTILIADKNEFFDEEYAEGYELEIKKEMKHDKFLLIDFS